MLFVARLNRWQDKIQLSNIDDNAKDDLVDLDDGDKEEGGGMTSRLQVLNLSDNKVIKMVQYWSE